MHICLHAGVACTENFLESQFSMHTPFHVYFVTRMHMLVICEGLSIRDPRQIYIQDSPYRILLTCIRTIWFVLTLYVYLECWASLIIISIYFCTSQYHVMQLCYMCRKGHSE